MERPAHLKIPGRYFEWQSSTSVECNMVVADYGAYIETDEGRYKSNHCDTDDLKVDPKVGSIVRKVHFPDGSIFETDAHDALDDLKPHGFWQRLSRTERAGWHLVPLAIITPFAAFALYRLLIPVIISTALFFTPDGVLSVIDKNSMKSIDLLLTDPSELPEERQAKIESLFKSLVEVADAKSDKRDYKYNLMFRSSKLVGPNAFALPGGTIVLTDDLVKQFPEDYVVAAVLAHEIGHVEHEHSLRQIYRALGIAAMVSMMAGDAGPMLEDVLLEGSAVLSLSFSRNHELQADNFSFDLLTESGYRQDGLITFFEKLEEDMPMPKDGEWMMTHPLSTKRIENIRAKMESANP